MPSASTSDGPGLPAGSRVVDLLRDVGLDPHWASIAAAVGETCFAASLMGIRDDQLGEEADYAVADLERRMPEHAAVWGDLRVALAFPSDQVAGGSLIALKVAAITLSEGAERARRLLNEAQGKDRRRRR